MARNATTIILLTRNELVRADFTRPSRRGLAGLWRQPRPDLPDPVSVVESALLQSPGVGRRVWLLSTDLWTQTLTVPSLKMAGLTSEQQAGALNYEAEGLSGQAAHDAAVGFIPQAAEGSETGYWLVQAPASQLAQVEEAVHRAGGQLAGLAHPSGLNRPLERKDAFSWQRVELWPDALVCIAAAGDAEPQVQVFNFDPQGGRWQGQVEQWRTAREKPDHFEMLVSADVNFTAPAGDDPIIRLADDAALERWLTAWAALLARPRVPVPHVTPAPRPMSMPRRWVMGVVLAVAAAAACTGHHLWVQNRRAEYAADLQAAQERGKRRTDLQKQAADAEARHKDLQQQLERSRQDSLALATQRRRLARLLAVLGEQRPDDLVVQKIDGTGGDLTVHGTCLKAEMADQLARAFVKESHDLHWDVGLSTKQALLFQSSGGPWTFDLRLKDLPFESGSATPSAKPAPHRR